MKSYDPFSDPDCISAFIENNFQDFDFWCSEIGIHKDQYCNYELMYCEQMREDFLEFGEKYFEDLELDEADRKNDMDKAEEVE